MDYKVAYLNRYLDSKEHYFYDGPKSLFKYRPFDDYAFEMLENEYVYLCPAEKLDDKTECVTTLDLQNLYDLETDGLKRRCVDLIIEALKPYTTLENFELIKTKIHGIMKGDHTVYPHFMLDISHEIHELAPQIDTATLVNSMLNIPKKLDDPKIKSQFKKFIFTLMNARKAIGVCSLCESCDVDDMWRNYADNESGYCIEYDVSDYRDGEIFPVIYDNDRQTNIVFSLFNNLIANSIQIISDNKIYIDRSQHLRLFLSKYKEWEYQREWRIIGDSGTKLKAPKIKTIYLGKNISKENKIKIKTIAKKMGIRIIEKEK